VGELSPLPIGYEGLELFVAGAWLDITADLSDGGIAIVRRPGDPARMSCSLKNGTGKYSPRNPSSPLFGLIGRNTPVRAFVDLGQPRLDQATTADYFSASDTAALDIAGDIDLRVDVAPLSWRPAGASFVGLVKTGAYSLFVTDEGYLVLSWTDAGAVGQQAISSQPVPGGPSGRKAIRATLDVDNGAGGRTGRFYTAGTIDGPWVEFGVPWVAAGTTSIANSIFNLLTFASATACPCDVFALEVRSGIDGTVVANPRFLERPSGTTSFTDTAGRSWTRQGAANLWNRHYRFTGEVSEWPQRWTKKGASSAYAAIECAGVRRRLGQGASPLRSALYRTISKLGPNLVAYWPLEDLERSSTLAAALPGVKPVKVEGTPVNGGFDGFDASAPIVTLAQGKLTGLVPNYGTGDPQVRWIQYIPAATADGLIVARISSTGGTLGWIDLKYSNAGNGGIVFEVYESDGTFVGNTLFASLDIKDKPVRMSVDISTSGANILVGFGIHGIGSPTGGVGSTAYGPLTKGRVTTVTFNPNRSALTDVAIGHVSVEKVITDLFAVSKDVLKAYLGEQADARIARLAAENALPVRVVGEGGNAQKLGPQGREKLLTLLDEAAESDAGLLFESRTGLGLTYRTLESLYSQTPAVTIAYTDNLLLPFEPVDDDSETRNDVTVTRDRGSSFTAVEDLGPLSTQAPPSGVGVYDEALTLSLVDDAACEDQAGWRLHLGTVDEARWPTIGVNLAHPTFLANPVMTRKILSLDLGDRVDVTQLPAWLPPTPVSQLAVAMSEQILPLAHKLELELTPARPYEALTWNDADRWSGAGTLTAEDLDATETGVDVTNPLGVEWTTADGSYDVVIGGERMRVNSVTGTGPAQTLNVARSVNGVVKTHLTGAAVTLYDPSFYGLLETP